jgi:hypothetical protein
VPLWLQWAGALVVVVLSIKPLYRLVASRLERPVKKAPEPPEMVPLSAPSSCGPT